MAKLKLKINGNLLLLFILSFLWLYMANLSDFVIYALTVTIRYKKETRVESSLSTAPAQNRFSSRN